VTIAYTDMVCPWGEGVKECALVRWCVGSRQETGCLSLFIAHIRAELRWGVDMHLVNAWYNAL